MSAQRRIVPDGRAIKGDRAVRLTGETPEIRTRTKKGWQSAKEEAALPKNSNAREMQWLLKEMRPFLRVHLGSLACVLIASLLSLCDPLILKWLIDVVLPRRQSRLLAVAAAGLLGSYLGRVR